MNRYQKAIRYTKPLVEIDEKIRHLNERMVTTGMYTVTNQDDGEGEQPPVFEPAPLGDMDPDNFSWPDQGDGSPNNDPNTSPLVVNDTLGREIPLFDYLPGVNYSGWNRQPDYSLYGGKVPLGIVFDGRALASTRYFWLGKEGLNFIMQVGAYTTPGPYSPLQIEFNKWRTEVLPTLNLTTKPITIWGNIDCLFGSCYGGSEYYPDGTSNSSDPLAERVLYSYTMYVPGTGNPNYASDPGVRSRPPRVNSILSRDDLGDPNYYAGNPNEFLMGILNVGKRALDYLLGSSKDFLGDGSLLGDNFMDGLTDGLTGLHGAAKTIANYWIDKLPPLIGNKFLGQDYVDNSFRDLEIGIHNGELISVVKDNVIGSGQYPTYDSKTNSIEVKFNYDFDTNAEAIAKEPEKYDRSNPVTGAAMVMAQVLGGDYGIDSSPVVLAGYVTMLAKALGGAKPKPGKITISPQKLKELNPKVYDQLIRTLDLPSDAINTPSNPDLGLDAPELNKDEVEKEIRKTLPPKLRAAMDFQKTMTMDNFNKLSKSDQNKIMDNITKQRTQKYDGSNFIDPDPYTKNLLKMRSDIAAKTKFKNGFMIDKDPTTGKERKIPLFSTTPGMSSMLALSHVPSGKVLTEGWESPKHTNIEKDMRKRFFDPKDIAPEYPKEPPASMVGGYSSKSKLAPKENDKELVIKITKKDLLRNHRLTKDEVQDMMDTINKINKFLAANPGELIHAQIRYPKDDPRLAELNWKMDQQLAASDKYIEKQFPENQRLFDKITQATKKSIALTDPKTFKSSEGKMTSINKLMRVNYVMNEYDPTDKEVKNKKIKSNKKSIGRFFKAEKKADTSRTRWLKG